MLKANEARILHYDTQLKRIDKVEVIFGYYLIKPSMHKALDLQQNIESTKFHILKNKSFEVR